MFWNVKKIQETERSIVIGFSKGNSFDGKIIYDKTTEQFEIVSLADTCDQFESERLFQFLYTLILQNTLSFKPYSIALG